MNVPLRLVVFRLDDLDCAVHLCAVEQVLRVVEITPLPQAPGIVLGVINVRGRVVPVVDARRRFRLPQREMQLSDHLMVVSTARHSVALIVDGVAGVVERAADTLTPPERIFRDLTYLAGVLKLHDGMVLIHDLEAFLSPTEEEQLERALDSGKA